MEAATSLRPPQVRTRGERLLIDGVQVADDCAVRLVREREQAGEDATKLIVDAIEIGARVLDREQTGANAEFVRAEFERAARELETEFVDRARGVAERLDAKVDEAFGADDGQVARVMARHFGADSTGAVQNQVRAIVGEVMAKSREDLVRQFSSADSSNPLSDFKAMAASMMRQAAERQTTQLDAMTNRLEEMRLEISGLRAEREKLVEVAAERDRGTAKGRTFEQLVHEAVDRLALAQGDGCEAVGDQLEGTRKTGDVVVCIDGAAGPGRGRIVFEAKTSQLSRPKALAELDRAIGVRCADYGILVVPTEADVPARMVPLREYGGDKLIVSLDLPTAAAGEGPHLALQVAYALARARVLMARGAEASERVDCAAIRETCERAVTAMEDVRRIKVQLTGARTQIDKAGEIVETMTTRVRQHVAEIDALVGAGAGPPSPRQRPARPRTTAVGQSSLL
ncbi:MAG: hypothetical protein QOD61_2009 [Solirubrobacteraceae bacterium]|nr:hypothetical protein [Solirubrobacteraceae bacterium]